MTINILCVDDEPSWRKIFQNYFREYLNSNVDLAENCQSGLEKIKQMRYDLIILDGLEGDCFRLYKNIKTIPHGDVVIFSGDVRIETEAKKQGIPFYSKSNATESLNEIIAQYNPTNYPFVYCCIVANTLVTL